MSRVLHHTIKNTKKEPWFGMIKEGIKKEEYKEIKPFWIKRLIEKDFAWNCNTVEKINTHLQAVPNGLFKKFDAHLFANGGHFGDGIPKFTIEAKGIRVGEGKSEWGAEPGKKYFVITLGEIIK
jgi:hypothetical protein